MAKLTKSVYAFEEGDGKNKMLLGGKGANLCEMTQIGLNVPPGFVITTEACLHYLDSARQSVPEDMMRQVREQMAQIEAATGKGFGDVQLEQSYGCERGRRIRRGCHVRRRAGDRVRLSYDRAATGRRAGPAARAAR